MSMPPRMFCLGITLALGLCGCSGTKKQSSSPAPATPATPGHIVIVMEENRSYTEIIGSPEAPYINSLATQGALFTQSFAITHPSQPNYLALFSGSTQGITDDSCPHTFSVASLESALATVGKTFAGYSEDLPQSGSETCSSGEYARKHVPWTDFSQNEASDNQPFSVFPSDFTQLPLVSFVIPNLLDDMHDGTIQQGDTWLKNNLSSYADWAMNNNSVLIITWDEDDGTENNQIATIFVGGAVKVGQYSETINHYSVLRTIENLYGLSPLANASSVSPIIDIWK
jgi:phosphatidylinositol-3-phosphatase